MGIGEVKQTPTRRWALKSLIFFYYATIGVILPFLPLYLYGQGLDTSRIGFLLAIGPLVSLVVQFPWGIISDRMQTVKKIIIFQLAASAGLVTLIFQADTFSLLALTMVFFYTFCWPVLPLLDSLTLNTVRESGGSFGNFRLWGSVGFALTALVSGSVLAVVGVDKMLYIYLGLVGVCIGLALLTRDTQPLGRPVTMQKARELLVRREVLLFLVIITFLSTTNKANDAFLGLFIGQLGGNEAYVGWAWTIAPLSEVPVFALGAFLLSRYNELTLLAVASAAFALRWMLFVLVPGPEYLLAVQLLHSITFGLFFMSAVAYMSKLAPPELRASGQGLLSAFIGGVGGIMGSLLGGLVMAALGPRPMYAMCAVVCVGTALAFAGRLQQVRREKAGVAV
ncbi:MAG: MFS transporter [Bacillota bacterium]